MLKYQSLIHLIPFHFFFLIYFSVFSWIYGFKSIELNTIEL